jgi:hypothetical protein
MTFGTLVTVYRIQPIQATNTTSENAFCVELQLPSVCAFRAVFQSADDT